MRTRAPRALPNSDPEPEPLEALVIDLWRAVHESDRFASALLAEAFRERRLRAPRARAFVADTLYAMLRAERTIDEALRLGRAEGRASSLAAGRAEAPADGSEPPTFVAEGCAGEMAKTCGLVFTMYMLMSTKGPEIEEQPAATAEAVVPG